MNALRMSIAQQPTEIVSIMLHQPTDLYVPGFIYYIKGDTKEFVITSTSFHAVGEFLLSFDRQVEYLNYL